MQNKGDGPIRQAHRLDMLYPLMQITKKYFSFFSSAYVTLIKHLFFLEIWFHSACVPQPGYMMQTPCNDQTHPKLFTIIDDNQRWQERVLKNFST